MKLFKNHNFLALLAGVALFASSCTAEQDVEPIISPDDFPAVTITPDGDYSSIQEGDILSYTITVDAFVNQTIDWSVVWDESSVADDSDISVDGGTLQIYSGETSLVIEVLNDGIPEMGETFAFSVTAAEDIGYNFQLSNPDEAATVNTTLANVNDPDQLTMAISWPVESDDWDLYVVDVDGLAFEDAAETGGVPELVSVSNANTNATFTLGAFPWAVETTETTFTVAVGHPDGSVDMVEIVVNLENENLEEDLGGNILIGNIAKSGSSYTFTSAL